MPMRESWLAVSPSRSTIILCPSPTTLIVPPQRGRAACCVKIQLGSSQVPSPDEVWVAISYEAAP